MDTKKILTTDLLDIIFDNRNKDYGAYDLRKTYDRRVVTSLLFTGTLIIIAITSFSFVNKLNRTIPETDRTKITVVDLIPIEKEPEHIEPPKKIEPPQARTEKFTDKIVIAKPEETVDPPPTVDDLAIANISNLKTDGEEPSGNVAGPSPHGDPAGVIDPPKSKEPEIYSTVEIDAKYTKDWTKFLLRNLKGEVPVENGAPAGKYTVYVQFVVSLDGSISEIKALTNHGYGMEEEAIRVIRKSDKWEPAIQNGRNVKAYRRQPVTFLVDGEN